MNGIVSLIWHIEPITPPRPCRHCPSCGVIRPFLSSGKVRLNANGQRLDAWLIYRCAICDRTWNRPLLDRAPVAGIPQGDLSAMQSSDRAWVSRHEQDLAALRQHCDQVRISAEVSVTRAPIPPGDAAAWSEINLTLIALGAVGQRLDRCLARELRLARSDLQRMHEGGALDCGKAGRSTLRRQIRGRQTLRFLAARLTDRQRSAVAAGLLPG